MMVTAHMKRLLLIVFVAVLAFCACTAPVRQEAAVDTVVDSYGRKVAVPTHPRRVVSLSPAVTEIMYAIGAQDLLVGRTDFCVYPPEAESIPTIGGISNMSVERVLSMNPDMVICGSMVNRKNADQIDGMGTPIVCVVEQPSFEGLYDNIAMIGRLVGRQDEANRLNDSLRRAVSSLPATDATPKSCYYVVGFGPAGNFTAGGNTFINDIIRLAGGRNIAESVTGWNYSMEALMKEDPDYIIVRREDSAAFCSSKPYNQLRAVREGHVIGIVSGMLDLQVPRNVDMVMYLRQRMYE